MLPSGSTTLFGDRVGWARYYLQRAKMLEPTRRSVYRITDGGARLLQEVVGAIKNVHLRDRSSDFRDWVSGGQSSSVIEKERERQVEDPATPEEVLTAAHQNLRRAVESDLLTRLRAGSPAFFEQAVVRLLVAMGYGGSREDAGR